MNNNVNVLVVDDEAISRLITAKTLETQGYVVDTADNGQDALTIWQEKRHPLIITDCHMPTMDGFTLTKSIRHIEENENLPRSMIIALTADAEIDELQRCTQAGMNNHIIKPISQEKLNKILTSDKVVREPSQEESFGTTNQQETSSAQTPVDYLILDQIFPDKLKQSKVLHDLQSHIHECYEELALQVNKANLDGIEGTAHRMKGSCKMVGVNQVASICAEIERKAKQGCIDVSLLLSTLKDRINQFDTYLTQQLNSSS